MLAAPARRLVKVSLVVLAAACAALAEDTARDLRDQAQADLQALRQQGGLRRDLQRHIEEALRALERTADAFRDANHVSSSDAFDRFHQAAESIRQGTREALRRSQVATADRLRADAERLAGSARLLVTTSLSELRADSRVIDRLSQRARSRNLRRAEADVARAAAALADTDPSLRPYTYARYAQAIEMLGEAWESADRARRFRLAGVSVEDSPDPFSPNGDTIKDVNVLTARYEVRLAGDTQTVRTELTISSSTGQVVRRITADTPVPRRTRGGPRIGEVTATLSFDGKGDSGAVLPEGTYSYQVTACILPEDEEEEDDEDEEDDEEDRCERGNHLDGSLTGTVTLDITAPVFGDHSPAARAILREARPEIRASFEDALAGIDPAGRLLAVRGLMVTDAATWTTNSVSYTPPEPLRDGDVDVRIVLVDNAGNAAELVFIFTIDTTPPVWRDVQPPTGSTTIDRREPFMASVADGGSGVDSVTLFLDEVNVTSETRVADGLVTFTPDGLAEGEHTYRAAAVDRAGNTAEAATTFEVVSAFVRVDPATGGTTSVTDPSSPILGASVEIPPGAVREATTVTIQSVPDPLPFPAEAVAAGPAVRIESSSGDFIADVLIRIPYDESVFPAGVSEEAAVLFVLEDGTSEWVQAEIVSVDVEANVIVARRRTLSVFRVGYLVPDAARSTVAVAPSGIEVAQSGLVIVTLRTASGAPIGRGHSVSARVVTGGGTVGSFTFQLDGTYAAALQAPNLVGTATLEASADGLVLAQRAIVEYTPGPASRFLLSPPPASIVAGTSFALTLSAVDAFGNLATGHRGEAEVTLATDTQMQINGANGPWTLVFGDTDPGRVNFTVTYRSAGAQSFRVEDIARGLFANSSVTRVDPAAPSVLSVGRGDGQVGTVDTWLVEGLRVRAADAFGNGVPSVGVDFEVTAGGGGIAVRIGDPPVPGPLARVTDAGGEAEVFLRLGPAPGANTVRASLPGTGTSVIFTATGQAAQTADELQISGPGAVPVESAASLVLTLRKVGQPVDGEANNLDLLVQSSTPAGLPVAFGVVTGVGGGQYIVDAVSAAPGETFIVARWNGGQVESPAQRVQWIAPDAISAQGPLAPVLIGMDAVIDIQLRQAGVGVANQERSLRVTVRGGGDPDAYAIGEVTPVGVGDYQCVVRSAVAGTATFDVSYDLLGTQPSPDLSTSVSIEFRLPDARDNLPHVVAWTPADGATGVAHNATLRITFDRLMDTRRTAASNLSVMFPRGPGQFAHMMWAKVPFAAYNSANGETRVACGDVDGDGRDEIIAGLGPYPQNGGWVAVFDDAREEPAGSGILRILFLRWIRVPFSAYNSASGETRPAVGDLDRDGRAEVVLGLGPYPANGGQLAVFDDASTGFAFLRWVGVQWSAYNTVSGATRPAIGDFDGDGAGEIAVGLDRVAGVSTPGVPGGNFVIHDDLLHSCVQMRWAQVNWSPYNSAVGESRPAAGNLDGDMRDELVIGLGPYPEVGGWNQVKDDAGTGYAPIRWLRLPQTGTLEQSAATYCAANGETWPACGDLDDDGVDEVAVGMGSFPANGGRVDGGRVWIFDDQRAGVPEATAFALLGTARLSFVAYNAANGETRPAIGNVISEPGRPETGGELGGDRKEELVVGLGPFSQNGGWIEVLNGTAPISVSIAFETEVVGDVTRTVALIRPTQQFVPGETYQIRVSGMFDLQSNPFNQTGFAGDDGTGSFLSTFTVATSDADTFRPEVASISPAPDSSNASPAADVVVEFTEPVDPATVTESSFRLRRGTTAVQGTITVEEGDRVARFRPQALGEGEVYTVTLTSDITDKSVARNRLIPWESQFRVTLTTRPTPPVIVIPPDPKPTQRWRVNQLTFQGTAEPGGLLRFFEGTVHLAEATVPMSGTFVVQVPATGAFVDGPHSVYARVRRNDGADVWSGDSRVVQFTIDTTPPARVSGLTAVAGPGYIEVAWEANDEPDLLGYLVYRSEPGGAFELINPVDQNDPLRRRLPIIGTRLTDSNIVNGVEYCYQVKAVDTAEPEQ